MDFDYEMDRFRAFRGKNELDLIEHMDVMSEFANIKYDHFKNIWTQYDEFSFFIGTFMSVWLLLFH